MRKIANLGRKRRPSQLLRNGIQEKRGNKAKLRETLIVDDQGFCLRNVYVKFRGGGEINRNLNCVWIYKTWKTGREKRRSRRKKTYLKIKLCILSWWPTISITKELVISYVSIYGSSLMNPDSGGYAVNVNLLRGCLFFFTLECWKFSITYLFRIFRNPSKIFKYK